MSRRTRFVFGMVFVVTVAALAPGAARAEDLRGADRFICASMIAVMCGEEGVCVEGRGKELNVPEFIEIDLQRKQMSTTEVSGEDRSTPITTLKREEGEIVLQGLEQGRAFSFVLSEESGRAAVAIAIDGATVSVFGVCTVMPSSR